MITVNAPPPPPPASVSHFIKTVWLHEWWLIKASDESRGGVKGKERLAIAGFSSPDQQAVREFYSAPILRRHDVFTLETVDGIIVLIKGFINKLRTKENGFPDEVFIHFVFGFPPYWEKYVVKYLEGGSGDDDLSRSSVGCEKLSSDSGSHPDFRKDTPNRKRKLASESMHKICDKDWNEAAKHSIDTGRILRTSNRLSDASQRRGDFNKGDPNGNRKVGSESTHKICDNRHSSEACTQSSSTRRVLRTSSRLSDVSQCQDDFPEGSPNCKIDDVSKLMHIKSDNKAINSHKKDSTQAGTKSVDIKRTLRSSSRPSTANQCLDAFQEGSPSINRKCGRNSGNRSCDEKNSSPVGKQSEKKSKELLRSSLKLSEVNQKDGFHTEDSRNKTKAVEASKSTGKTKRKLTYGSPVSWGQTDERPSVSADFSSLKKSRSGRTLLPTLEFWRNQKAVYDMNHELTGIKEGLPMHTYR